MSIPSYTPNSCWLRAMFNKANALAALPSLQSFLGVADTAGALAGNMYMHTSGRVDEGLDVAARKEAWRRKLPAVELGVPGGTQVLNVDRPATGMTRNSGLFELLILRETAFGVADDIAELDFQDEVGLIAEEMLASFELDASDVAITDFSRVDDTGKGEYREVHTAMLLLAWGVSGGED